MNVNNKVLPPILSFHPSIIFPFAPTVAAKFISHLLGDFNAKVGREDIFKPTIGNENLHEIRNDNGVRVVNLATAKSQSKVQCSHTVTVINLVGHLLT
jgi:hypothetical protein